jgi:hypothetical protein
MGAFTAYYLLEQEEENYFETLDMVVKWLSETMKLETTSGNIDYVTRLGRRKGERQISIKFTSFSRKLEVFKNKRNLAGSKVRVDEDVSIKDSKTRKGLVYYLKDAKKWGHEAFLRKDVFIVNRRTYDLSYLRENIQLEAVTRQLDNPVRAQDMAQQRAGNSENRESNSTRQSEHRAMTPVRRENTETKKMTTPQRYMVLRHNTHRQQRPPMTSMRLCKQTDSSII